MTQPVTPGGAPEDIRVADAPPRRKCVLVVDDEEAIRQALGMMLEDEGFAVLAATNGQAALDLLDGGADVDAILLDMRMPVMDGWRFAEGYRRRPEPRAPVIVLTATQNPGQACEDIGADGCVPKPFQVQDLLACLEHPSHRHTS